MAWSDLRPNTGSDDTNSVVPGSVIDLRPVLGDGRWRFGYAFPEFTIMPEKNPSPRSLKPGELIERSEHRLARSWTRCGSRRSRRVREK